MAVFLERSAARGLHAQAIAVGHDKSHGQHRAQSLKTFALAQMCVLKPQVRALEVCKKRLDCPSQPVEIKDLRTAKTVACDQQTARASRGY